MDETSANVMRRAADMIRECRTFPGYDGESFCGECLKSRHDCDCRVGSLLRDLARATEEANRLERDAMRLTYAELWERFVELLWATVTHAGDCDQEVEAFCTNWHPASEIAGKELVALGQAKWGAPHKNAIHPVEPLPRPPTCPECNAFERILEALRTLLQE